MMILSDKCVRRIGIVCLFIGLLTALCFAGYRWQAEQNYRAVEILLDYDQLQTLAKAEGQSLTSLAAQFRTAGATGVIVRERTLADLDRQGDFLALRGTEIALRQKLHPEFLSGFVPVPQNTYLLFSQRELFADIAHNLALKKPEVVVNEEDDWFLLGFYPTGMEWDKLGVGFPRTALKEIADGGLTIVPRVRYWADVRPEAFETWSSAVGMLPGLSLVTFNDEQIPGAVGHWGQLLQEWQVPLGLFEFYEQKGLANLAHLVEKNVVRIHCLNENEMAKSNEREALERFTLAVAERNIRALYVRLFNLDHPQTALSGGLSFISKIKDEIEGQGFTVGTVSNLAGIPYSRLFVFLIALGVWGGGLLFLRYFLTPRNIAWWGGGSFLIGVVLLFFYPLFARKAFAFLAVVIFPMWAVLTFVRQEKRTIREALQALMGMTGLSLLGALLLVGLLADKSFMLKLSGFSGVKLAHLLPLLILPFYFFWKEGTEKPGAKIRRVLQTPLSLGYILAAFFLLAVFAVYLLRTGNSMPSLVGVWELKLRGLLHSLLAVRPRTKEFLIGYPFMFLCLVFGYTTRKLPLLFLGIMGQISLVNTYAHIHTPLPISLLRSLHGLWLGILVGLLLLLVVRHFIMPLTRRFRE